MMVSPAQNSNGDVSTTSITLSHNDIGMDVSSLVNTLSSNDQVLRISFHAPFVADLSSVNLTRLLEACANIPQLEELWVALPYNRSHLSSLVVSAVAQGDVEKLTLRGMDEAGCVAMAKSLNGMMKLRELNFYGNLSTEACLELLSTLKDNDTLQQLRLPDCGFNTNIAGGKELSDALRGNITLKNLELIDPEPLGTGNDDPFEELVMDEMSRSRLRSSASSLGGVFVSLTEDETFEFVRLKTKKEDQRRRRSSKEEILRASAA